MTQTEQCYLTLTILCRLYRTSEQWYLLKLTIGQQHSHTHHHQLRGDANTHTTWKHKGKTFIAMFTSLSTLGSLEKTPN